MKIALSDFQLGDIILYDKQTYIIIYRGKYGVTALDTYSHNEQSLSFQTYGQRSPKATLLDRTGLTTIDLVKATYPEYFL